MESTPAKETAGPPEVTVAATAATTVSQGPNRRFSFLSLNFTRKDQEVHKAALSATQGQEKRGDPLKPSSKPTLAASTSDRRAQNSALTLRSLIVGSTSTTTRQTTPLITKFDLSSIKSQLMEPKTANKVIAQLKALPASDDPLHTHKSGTQGPIHAVCLAYTDAEADALHFSKLVSSSLGEASVPLPGVISASVEKVAAVFKEMHIIDLISAPGLGLGQPADGKGLLAGALPTAETVMDGAIQITPQLMALGFATGKALTPDHTGISFICLIFNMI